LLIISFLFYFCALDYLSKRLKLNKKEIISNNLYAIEIDSLALDVLKIKLFDCIEKAKIADLGIISKNIVNKNMLIEDRHFSNSVDYQNDFKDVMNNGGFDVIISNPPYFLLKINKKSLTDKNLKIYNKKLKQRVDNELDFFRSSGRYNYSIEGMLNYYKISIEMMFKIGKENCEIGIICPSTLFADISSKKLRKHIILDNTLREINYFPESEKIFSDITQSTVIFYLRKGGKTNTIKIKSDGETFTINLDLIEKAFGVTYEIPYIDSMGWSILSKISNNTTLGEIPHIRNKRGELDLTKYKRLITKQNTGWRLVRGNMISKNSIIDKNGEFVIIDEFLQSKTKEFLEKDFKKERLICQQISNMGQKKRLNFVRCKPSDVLANSCNYLTINELDTNKLCEVLNSYLLNWRFKITSSNNHINNYELEELPITNLDKLKKTDSNPLKTNIRICNAYGLDPKEIVYILKPFFKIEQINEEIRNENIQSH
jgi:Alw26I/Eco31I/Esp3I family type II restriction m6 adenine DNA methyltransferase